MDVGEDVGQNVAMKFDEIWLFIEQKLKTKVPNYFKNILKVCGYNNGITIASIEESDVKYFTEEVRKGNVTNFFNGIDGKTVLEGCNKTAENFEFTRGHEQFLLSIAKYVKKHLDDNGPDSFILSPEQAPEALTLVKTKPKNLKIAVLPQKRKMSEVQSIAESTVTVNVSNQELQPSKASNNEISKYKTKLLSKVVTSLRVHTPEMYEKHKQMINEKIASTLVELLVKSDGQVETADISCPFCKKTSRAFHTESSSKTRRWNSSNFDRHLKRLHPNQCDNIQMVDIEEKVEVPSTKIDEKPNCTVKSGQASEPLLISSGTTKVAVADIHQEKQCDVIKLSNVGPVAQTIVCYSDSGEEGEEEPRQRSIKLNILTESSSQEKKHFKKHLDDNGPDSFILAPEQAPEALTLAKSKQKKQRNVVLPQKRKKSEVQSIAASTVTVNISNHELQPSKAKNNKISKHKTMLLRKVITSLRLHTPEMYEKHKEMINEKSATLIKLVVKSDGQVETADISCPFCKKHKEMINEKSATLIKLVVKSDGQVETADISCPFCKKVTRAFHSESSNGIRRWNSSNFDRHLKRVHPNQCDNIQMVDIEENVEVPSPKTDDKPNCTITSVQASEPMLISSGTKKAVVADKLINVGPVAQSIVCYSDSDEEGEEEPRQRSIKLNILTKSLNQEKKIVPNQEIEEESISQLKQSAKVLNDTVRKADCLIVPKKENFVSIGKVVSKYTDGQANHQTNEPKSSSRSTHVNKESKTGWKKYF